MQTLAILWNTLGVTGLLSAAAAVMAAALIVLGIPRRSRFRVWFAATVAAAAAVGLAIAASQNVRSIEVDRSGEMRAAEEAGGRVAQERLRSRAAAIRFAEDTARDQANVAGVTVAEEEGAYDRAVAEALAKQTGSRRGAAKGRARRNAPADAAPPPADEAPATAATVRTLPEAQLVVADRFDRANRALAWGLFTLAVGLCGCEYVRRFNSTLDPVWPLPLAGTVVDGLTSKEYAARLPAERLAEFLRMAVRKGETFLVFAPADPLAAADTLDRLTIGLVGWRLPKRTLPAASLATDPGLLETVFETAWFGRGCFVVTGDQAAGAVLERMVDRLAIRSQTRARARRTLDLVWALQENPPAAAAALARLGPRLNVRWIISPPAP